MFITIEGIDGTGKTTQASGIVDQLSGIYGKGQVLWTREPGGWNQGDLVRNLLLRTDLRHLHSELYLFLVDRCEHVAQVIEPALNSGKIVVCERYIDSTLAYQVWGRGLSLEKVEDLFAWSAFPVPDITIWLDMNVQDALIRVMSRGSSDRIESDGLHFLQRVRKGYMDLCRREPHRIHRIDAEGSQDNVRTRVLAFLEKQLSCMD